MNSKHILVVILIAKLISATDTDSHESGTEIEPNFVPHDGPAAEGGKKLDYYEYRHVVAEGVQRALSECREKFKWDRWNCPKRAFVDILRRQLLPSNKELGLTRALIASGIVLSLTRSCSYGNGIFCGCVTPALLLNETGTDPQEFVWKGCDDSIKLAFGISRVYLESQDTENQDEASRKVNAHNYEVGRLAVKRNMNRMCKCHGVSGTCQVQTCWTRVPDMSKVGAYLKHKFRLAAKVGAMAAVESDLISLNRELAAINKDKMVFVDASPDYCFENAHLGVNGTLGRYCSRTKHRPDGSEVSRYERDSCDRLCTRCGYKIKREIITVDKQCQCKFNYCCSVHCKRCPTNEEAYKCVRHS